MAKSLHAFVTGVGGDFEDLKAEAVSVSLDRSLSILKKLKGVLAAGKLKTTHLLFTACMPSFPIIPTPT